MTPSYYREYFEFMPAFAAYINNGYAMQPIICGSK